MTVLWWLPSLFLNILGYPKVGVAYNMETFHSFWEAFFSLDIIPFNRFKKKIIFLFIADITMIFLPNVLSSLWQRHNFNLYFYPAIISISHQDCIFDLHNCVSSWWQGCTCVDSHTVSRLYGISRLLNDSFIEINCIIYSTLHYHFA